MSMERWPWQTPKGAATTAPCERGGAEEGVEGRATAGRVESHATIPPGERGGAVGGGEGVVVRESEEHRQGSFDQIWRRRRRIGVGE